MATMLNWDDLGSPDTLEPTPAAPAALKEVGPALQAALPEAEVSLWQAGEPDAPAD